MLWQACLRVMVAEVAVVKKEKEAQPSNTGIIPDGSPDITSGTRYTVKVLKDLARGGLRFDSKEDIRSDDEVGIH